MRLIMLLMVVGLLLAALSDNAQVVTLNMKKVPIQKVFTEISRQTNISIIYKESTLAGVPPVTVNVKDATVKDALDQCLQGLPLAYSVDGTTITIKRSPPPPGGSQ